MAWTLSWTALLNVLAAVYWAFPGTLTKAAYTLAPRSPPETGLFVLRGDIVSQIENAIGGFFGSILNGIESFFGNIFASIGNLFASIFQAPVNAINSSWATLNGFTSGWGPLAPIITVVIVIAVVLIVVWAIWLVVRVSTSEAEKEGDEVEEGV